MLVTGSCPARWHMDLVAMQAWICCYTRSVVPLRQTQKLLLACNGSSSQDEQLTALLLVATAASGVAQEPMPPHGVGPSWGRALVSAGLIKLCWQPSGYAVYNRPFTTK